MFLLGTEGAVSFWTVWPPMECSVCHKAAALVTITTMPTGNKVLCWDCSEPGDSGSHAIHSASEPDGHAAPEPSSQ